ncbi:hypothetical protein V6N13_080823 [Hibiscus sabdariffa]|uniref:RNase H type-1 domain-containing protein n=2 Tax=Hibiscus sabdariffa TaxID=183260 RepID=A0ABR2CB97_9ROSI
MRAAPSTSTLRRWMQSRWRTPSHCWNKLNTEGAQSGLNGSAAFDGVLRSSAGTRLVGFSKSIDICTSPMAELWGVLEGLVHAWNYGERRIIVELDNAEAIGGPQGREVSGIPHRIIQHMFATMDIDRVVLVHSFQENNKVADRLAERCKEEEWC